MLGYVHYWTLLLIFYHYYFCCYYDHAYFHQFKGLKNRTRFKYKPHVLSGSLEQYLHTWKSNSLGWQNRYDLDCVLVVTMWTWFGQSLSKLHSPGKLMQRKTMCQAWGRLRNFYEVPVAKFNPRSSDWRNFPFTYSWTELLIFWSQTCWTDPDCLGTSKEGKLLLFVRARESFRQKGKRTYICAVSRQDNERAVYRVDGK